MDSMIPPQCFFCSQGTKSSEPLAPYTEVPCCSQCRLSASESNMQLQQELAALFEKSMTLNLSTHLASDQSLCSVSPDPKLYSIGQNPASNMDLHPTAIDTLRYHNIDPETLLLRQWKLYEGAMPEQRSRLIQMWQLSPEHRYHSDQGETKGAGLHDHGATNKTACMSGLWNASFETRTVDDLDMYDFDRGVDYSASPYAEPYMITGYRAAAQTSKGLSDGRDGNVVSERTTGSPYRLANDPVYRSQGQRWWEYEQSASPKY
ncbi:hypothetical protein BO82DRAFT_296956 [Aspergillus uvarum CBS 121591]|uniref:Uncharacterized protein n=1 Tax=Aspergillus uvarum CBS 121591 TaxID=1448315 RepID=A0A319CL58_9EURO|nr:hypothetical protein BO82DRAFT_296956 [Aspergillus uvarum CBS 121591]PYH76148.1 hypothetical protein BO82DRAFT_296956 [Aspergillus uvarum CBS 121591]